MIGNRVQSIMLLLSICSSDRFFLLSLRRRRWWIWNWTAAAAILVKWRYFRFLDRSMIKHFFCVFSLSFESILVFSNFKTPLLGLVHLLRTFDWWQCLVSCFNNCWSSVSKCGIFRWVVVPRKLEREFLVRPNFVLQSNRDTNLSFKLLQAVYTCHVTENWAFIITTSQEK